MRPEKQEERNNTENNDNNELYGMECWNPSDDEPDDILASFDSESNEESDDIV